VGQLAALFELSARQMGRLLAGQRVRNKRLNRQTYLVDLDDLPAPQAPRRRHRPAL
jgi:hypothetical protein